MSLSPSAPTSVPAALALTASLCAVSGAAQDPQNVLVVVADDLGVDMLESYGLGTDPPKTPTLDLLAKNGVRFVNATANPVCSPTRATLLTGRFARRTGLGNAIEAGGSALPLEEFTLPELLEANGVATAAFGKWHLGSDAVGGDLAPNLAGFSHYAGSLENQSSEFGAFYEWEKTVDGVTSTKVGYLTLDTARDATVWMLTQPEPWFCYVAFHAPHEPLHKPPPYMHSVDFTGVGPSKTEPRPYYLAMVESLDWVLGRMLAFLGEKLEHTTVIFLSDNGSPEERQPNQVLSPVVLPPFDFARVKGTLYEGGVRVPLIAYAPWGAKQAVSDALVNTTDLYATVAQIAGIDLPGALPPDTVLDSISFAPHLVSPGLPSTRSYALAERFLPNGPGPYTLEERSLREARFKLLELADGTQALYDLWLDPFEHQDLLDLPLSPEADVALQGLEARLALLEQGFAAGLPVSL